MAIQLPELPYALDALAPHISKKTLEFHYGKHHRKYVDTTNELIQGTDLDLLPHEELIFEADRHKKYKKIFNNAAQAWNHTFYWHCLSPDAEKISTSLSRTLAKSFGSIEEFKNQFVTAAKDQFGSGWAWLTKSKGGRLRIRALSNAGNPLVDGEIPILTCDVWEHAYYLDYQNERPKYLERFWSVLNWETVESNLDRTPSRGMHGAIRTGAAMMDHWHPKRDLPAQGLS